MLGNWSFGDYFKVCIFFITVISAVCDFLLQKEAIEYSWELLTSVYQLSPDRLYVTYFEGDAKNGLEPDLEAKQYWLERGVPEDHILPGNAKDNFWGAFSRRFAFLNCSELFRNGTHWSMWSL